METSISQIKRVTFTYDDGKELYIESEELIKWTEFNAIVARHAARDGVNPNWEDIKWTDTKDEIFY